MEGKTGEALEHSRRAVALGARDRGIVEFLNGVSAYVKNPTDPSLEPFRRMLADADLKAGAALYGRGKKAEGTARVREALGLSPSFAEAHNELGTQLVNEGRLEEAETEFVLASKIDPGLASAHNNLGYVLFLRGRIAAAIEQYGEALRLQPEFPLARSNLDRALRERGEEIKTGNSPHQVSPSR
jgi:tetratricopeptide (TPR) repeat protein